MDRCEYVSFASAGTRGAAYVGLLEALEDHLPDHEAWRRGLRGVAGTSAGALAALVLALGLDRDARRAVLTASTGAVLRSPDIALLLQRFGLEEGRAFRELVRDVLAKGGLSAECTLADLKRLLRIDFVCVTTDLRDGRPLFLRAQTAPDTLVCDAVYASCCVPFVFTPQRLGEALCVDGCLSCSLPEVFDEAATLFVVVEGEGDGETRNWMAFLHAIVHCATRAQDHRVDRLADRALALLRLPLPPALAKQTPTFDPDVTAPVLDALVTVGYVAAADRLLDGACTRALRATVRAYLHHAVPLLIGGTSPDERPPPGAAEAATAASPRS